MIYDTLVLDCETMNSPDWCRCCLQPEDAHHDCVDGLFCATDTPGSRYTPIGWHNRPALGMSIGMGYWYSLRGMEAFDATGIEALLMRIVQEEPFVVGFNHASFDMTLLRGLLRREADALRLHAPSYVPGEPERLATMEEFATAETYGRYQHLTDLCDRIKAYCQGPRCWDLLQAIWLASPETKRVRGLNGLDGLAQANGLGATVISGAEMPRLWREGQYAAVLTHCLDDVKRTVLLFEMALRGEPLKRLDGSTVRLQVPEALQEWWATQRRTRTA